MKKKNEEEILKIQQVIQRDESNCMGHNNGNMPESMNAAVPLEELTQYTMKTGKNADIDLIRSTTATRKGADMDHLKVTKSNQVSDVSSEVSSRGSGEVQDPSVYPSNSSLPLHSVHSQAACVQGDSARVTQMKSSSRKKITSKTKK